MLVRPPAPEFAAAAMFASLLVTGCSGDGSAEATGERAYYGCLEENGVLPEKRDGGVLRVDKDKNDATAQSAAEAKCADLLPGVTSAASVSPPPAAFLEAARQFSACVRGDGFPAYPDPDPATSEVELPVEETATHWTPEFRDAVAKCSADPRGGGIVGG